MKQGWKYILIFACCMVMLLPFVQAQKQPKQMSTKQQMKLQQEKKLQHEKEEQEAMIKLQEQHLNNQTKFVQKLMKKAQKKSKKIHNNRKEFFISKWFRSKFTQ